MKVSAEIVAFLQNTKFIEARLVIEEDGCAVNVYGIQLTLGTRKSSRSQ